jgi:protease-4
MSDEAASGGYDIAMTGDPIVAEPGTITGSIGIVYGKLNLKGLYDKLGIHKDILSRGKFSGMDSDYGPYTAEERERVRALMEDFYKKFVSKVATARKMTPEQVDALAQGRVWTGEQAKANGLIDDVGGLTRALEIVKQKAGIAKDARVELVEYPKKRSLFELLLSRAQMEQPRLPAGWSQWDRVVERIEKLSQRPLWARVPYALDIR